MEKFNETKLAALALAGVVLATGLCGCDSSENEVERKNVLSGTILEGTCVVTFEDGSKDIARAISDCTYSSYCHYHSVISGIYYGDSYCPKTYVQGDNVLHHYGITGEEPISNYLTDEDYRKVLNGEFTDDDLIEIVDRTSGKKLVFTYDN